MKLTGGNYGGFILNGNSIELNDISISVIFNDVKNEFYIIDENQYKWHYRIDTEFAILYKCEQ